MNADYKNLPGYTEYLDLDHRYFIVIALKNELEDELIDCHFWDEKTNEFKNGFIGMSFGEKEFLLMEQYLFNFIDAECDLLINMYEEEFATPDKLSKILEISERMISNSDNDEFVQLANEFIELIKKAIAHNSVMGFCF